MADKFEPIEQSLEMFIENTRQMGIIVSDFQPQGQQVLNQKLQTLINGMQEIDKLKHQLTDVQVPMEVFEYIDQGKNPNLYTKDCLEKALLKNEQVKGKIESLKDKAFMDGDNKRFKKGILGRIATKVKIGVRFKRFKIMLLVELSKTFPGEVAKYRALRGMSDQRDLYPPTYLFVTSVLGARDPRSVQLHRAWVRGRLHSCVRTTPRLGC